MWSENPKCNWCKKDTILLMRAPSQIRGVGKVRPREDEATIDHLFSRYNPDRQTPNLKNEKRLVLACWQCNQNRGKEESAAQPIEELHKRSEHK